MMSSVCKHTHTEAYTRWFVGKSFVSSNADSMCIDIVLRGSLRAKNFKRQALGWVVLGGHTAFNVMMDL